MQPGSDNFRSSAIQDIIKKLRRNNINVIIYKPTLNIHEYNGFIIENDIKLFKEKSSIILVNRMDSKLEDLEEKVYTRDIFFRD